MTKTFDAAMQTHLDTGVTSLVTCILIERRDGQVVRVTDHDQDLVVSYFDDLTQPGWNGTYVASGGFERSAVQHAQDSVSNAEATAIVFSAGFLGADVRAELYDHARIHIFLVSWDDLTRGYIKMPGSGWVGDIESFPKKGSMRVELRGMGQALKQKVGQSFSPTCRVDLFSPRCRLDAALYLQHGYLESVTGRNQFISNTTAASFSPVAQTITNPDFNVGEFQVSNWTDEHEAYWTNGPYRSSNSGAPTTGTGMLLSSDQTGPGAGVIPLGYGYGIFSDSATFSSPDPSNTDVDNGAVMFEVSIDIARDTAQILDEAAFGVKWLDGSDVLIQENLYRIDTTSGLTDQAFTTFTRTFITPPGARKFQIRIVSYRLDSANNVAKLRYDNVVITAKPIPVLAVGQNRDGDTLSDYYDHGLIVFKTGPNAGVAREIETFDDGTKEFVLFLPLPYTPTVGDQFDVYPGCKHRWLTDCVGKFDNGINFQGEPFVPGDDFYGTSPDVKVGGSF